MNSKWRDFKNDPPEYKYDGMNQKYSPEIIVCTENGDMAIVTHTIWYDGEIKSFDSWKVSGVSGYEWDFDYKYDNILYWAPISIIPRPPINIKEK